MTDQIAKQLVLLDGKTNKQICDILYNLGHISKDFSQLLSIVMVKANREVLLDKYERIEGNPLASTKTLADSASMLLLSDHTSYIMNPDVIYVVYKLISGLITQQTFNKLSESLGITPMRLSKRTQTTLAFNCEICTSATSVKLCRTCLGQLKEFTEYRRESFIVPINYFNFKRPLLSHSGSFGQEYMDWIIQKQEGNSYIEFTLHIPEVGLGLHQYPLPFIEEQKSIYLS